MAKLSRTQLKDIVKECLMEILSEGLGDTALELNENVSRKSRPKRRKAAPAAHRSPVDTVSFNSAVDTTVGRVTNDPLMSSLLSDTASTTLQEQYSAEESTLAGQGSDAGIPLGTPGVDIFGEASQNWADLAFPVAKS